MTTDKWVAVDMFTGEIITNSAISKTILKHREIVECLASLCHMLPPLGSDGKRAWNRMTQAERGMLNRCAKQLHDAEATLYQIEHFDDWWYDQDWRGKEKRQIPGPWDVVKNWSRYLNWMENTPDNNHGVAQDWLNYLNASETPGTAAYRLRQGRDDQPSAES